MTSKTRIWRSFSYFGLSLLVLIGVMPLLPHAAEPDKKLPGAFSDVITFRHPEPVLSVLFLGSPATVATSCYDGFIRVWDVKSGNELARMRIEEEREMFCMTASSDGKTIYTGSQHRVEAWDVKEKKRKWRTEIPYTRTTEDVFEIALSPDSAMVAAVCMVNNSALLNAQTGKLVGSIRRDSWSLKACSFSSDSKHVLIVGYSEVSILNVASQKIEREVRARAGETLTAAKLTPDDKTIAILSANNEVALWDFKSALLIHRFARQDATAVRIKFIDNDSFLTLDNSGEVIQWSIGQKKILGHRKCAAGEITDLAISTDGKRFAIGCVNGDAKVFDLKSR